MVLATHRWPRFEHKLQMDSIIIIVDCPSHTVSPTSPPPASLAHSLISARDMHLATQMLYCLCHFASRCEPSWAPMACARLQHNGESCLLLDSSRPSFCLSVPCPSRYKRPCTPHTLGLSLSDSLLHTLVQYTSVQFFCYHQLHTRLYWSTTKGLGLRPRPDMPPLAPIHSLQLPPSIARPLSQSQPTP